MTAHFGDLVKRSRYEELSAELEDEFQAPWTWDRFERLLSELGVDDPYGFLAAGWWLPVDARIEPGLVERYADEAERAMADGVLPQPHARYKWDDVIRLMKRCRIEPLQVVQGLLWEYAYTPGEQVFIDALRHIAKSANG